MRRYRHIFFDLDHTLWDFTANSRSTLRELYLDLGLEAKGVAGADDLIEAYEEVNRDLWGRYEQGHIPKEVMRVLRFRTTLARFGVSQRGLAETMSREYLDRCPRRTILFPGVLELLHDLRPHYRMHIITNGFEEVQSVKLKSSSIDGLFDNMVTSERAGASKPSPVIFEHARRRSGALAEESLMVGDNILSDMLGARQAGWDQAHFAVEVAPDPEATYQLRHMDDLRTLLL
jgi:putative hydrolase of the HAD superfamily